MAKLKNPQTVYTLPAILYAPGAPVWITGGKLLRTSDGLLYAALTLQVIDAAALRSVTAAIQPLDAEGAPVGLELPYRYRVKAERDARFGEAEPILLPVEEAASFRVRVTRADFVGGESWRCDAPWSPLPAQETLEEHYGDAALADQFRIRYGADCRFAIHPVEDLWLCTCGAPNRAAEAGCHRCHRVRSALESVSRDALRGESESRARREPIRLEEAKAANRSLMRRLLLAAAIVLPVLILVIGLLIAVPRELERKNLYEGAQWLAGIGEFEEARAAFASLGDYRDSAEMAGKGLDYLRACELRRRGELDDPSALQMIGRTRSDLDEDTTAAMLLFDAAREEFEALGDYRDSAEQADACGDALEESRRALIRCAYDRAEALLESGKLSAARAAFLALGDTGRAAEPVYRKAAALTDFIRRYNIRGIYASLSMEEGEMSHFSMAKDKALTLGSQSVTDLLASCGEDPAELQLEDEPGAGQIPLDQAVIRLLESIDDYRDSAELLSAIAEATDYTREFYTLCESGDIFGAYEWLLQYDGSFEDRESWLSDLERYMPYCAAWDLYLGDPSVIPLTLGRNESCTSFRSRVLIRDGVATLRLTDSGGEYSVDLTADQGSDRFYNDNDDTAHYLVVITKAGHMSYLKYSGSGKLISSCEYEPAE